MVLPNLPQVTPGGLETKGKDEEEQDPEKEKPAHVKAAIKLEIRHEDGGAKKGEGFARRNFRTPFDPFHRQPHHERQEEEALELGVADLVELRGVEGEKEGAQSGSGDTAAQSPVKQKETAKVVQKAEEDAANLVTGKDIHPEAPQDAVGDGIT